MHASTILYCPLPLDHHHHGRRHHYVRGYRILLQYLALNHHVVHYYDLHLRSCRRRATFGLRSLAFQDRSVRDRAMSNYGRLHPQQLCLGQSHGRLYSPRQGVRASPPLPLRPANGFGIEFRTTPRSCYNATTRHTGC
ncbi:hypothetical protein CPB85DRAFT_403669 [Mucidula mucida]|nr:hypothetical protein CPB85DRAFT_403669 [Mucidula mucida]